MTYGIYEYDPSLTPEQRQGIAAGLNQILEIWSENGTTILTVGVAAAYEYFNREVDMDNSQSASGVTTGVLASSGAIGKVASWIKKIF